MVLDKIKMIYLQSKKSANRILNTLSSHIATITIALLTIFAGYGAQAQETAGTPGTDTLTIRFFGDIMMHSQQITSAATKDGVFRFDRYFTHIGKYLNDSDLNVANMEFTLAGEPYTGYPTFSAPDQYARHIADCGFNIFLAANNHICDKRSAGMARTLQIYRDLAASKGIYFTGLAGNTDESARTTPLIIEVKGIKIALVNATYGTNLGYDHHWPKTNYLNNRKMLEGALKTAEDQADITIFLPHWGEEYKLRHNNTQREMAQWMADNGADAVIGSHPHVIQDYEILTSGDRQIPVVYSLGNAISNMSAENTQVGLMVTMKITRSSNGKTDILPLEFTYLWSSRPGGYCNSYTILPLTEFLDRPEDWTGSWEHNKMATAYQRVAESTGIKEN